MAIRVSELILSSAPKIALALVLILFIQFLIARLMTYARKLLSKRVGRALSSVQSESETQKRLDTLFGIFHKSLVLVVWGLGLVIMLSALGVDIGPIITAAGVLGLAVSFGAQNLVRDVITGVFMLIDDQVRVGDVVTINGVTGAVENVNLRNTVLRDEQGAVHVFANGAISSSANLTKEWSGAVIRVGVGYEAVHENVLSVLADVGRQLKADPKWSALLVADFENMGIENLGDSAVVYKVRQKTIPNKQGDVAAELRSRIKVALDHAGIAIPFPQMSVHLSGKASV